MLNGFTVEHGPFPALTAFPRCTVPVPITSSGIDIVDTHNIPVVGIALGLGLGIACERNLLCGQN